MKDKFCEKQRVRERERVREMLNNWLYHTPFQIRCIYITKCNKHADSIEYNHNSGLNIILPLRSFDLGMIFHSAGWMVKQVNRVLFSEMKTGTKHSTNEERTY